jgi:hypothetical protein
MIRQKRFVRACAVLIALAATSASFGQVLVNTDFEPPLNSVGNLNGQPSTGPNPWTSVFGVINNGGFFLETQSAQYGNNMPSNAMHDHSYVDLGPVLLLPGRKLRATVDVYMDPAQPNLLMGLAAYANGHANQLGWFGGQGSGFKGGAHGTNNTATLVGNIHNPVHTGWHNVGLEIEQVSPTTLVTQYLFDGGLFTHNGFTITTHTDIAPIPNFVTDIALFSMNTGGNTEVGIGFYDNYRVAIVPEPGTAVLLVMGAAVMRLRGARFK